MRRSAFADAAADRANDAIGSATSSEAQGLTLPVSSASFSAPSGGALSSPEQQQQRGELKLPLLPPFRPGKGGGKALDAAPERHRLPPESWHRRVWWRGAVSGAMSALALLCLVALVSAAFSSPPSASSSSPVSASQRASRSGGGGGFARMGSLPPPRLLSDEAQESFSSYRASKLENEAGFEAGTAAEKGGGVTDGGSDAGENVFFASRSFSSSFNDRRGRTLVSYAYFEKDDVQAANLAFFSAFGMGLATKEEKGGGGGQGSFSKKSKKTSKRRRSPFLPPPPPATDFVVVVSGPSCTPCATFTSLLLPDARIKLPGAPEGISGAWYGVFGGEEETSGTAETAATTAEVGLKNTAERGGGDTTTTTTVTLLHRVENDGMDFGAHNVTLAWLEFLERHEWGGGGGGGGKEAGGELEEPGDGTSPRRHSRLIFLNSSARGPFLPKYLPEGWHWTDAFCRDLDEEEDEGGGGGESGGETSENHEDNEMNKKPVALVGAALTCLPAIDAGGPGPRVESWAFALSLKGLQLAKEAGMFASHGCKLCADGVVVAGKFERKRGEMTKREKNGKLTKN